VGNHLEGQKPGKVVFVPAFRRVAACASFLERLRVNGGGGIFFSQNTVPGVTGIALGAKVSLRRQAMPIFLVVTFPAGNGGRPFERHMGCINDVGVAVFTLQDLAVSGVPKVLY
jgi:hypothetical protein